MPNYELHFENFDAVADAMDDSPFTVISTYLLRHKLCRAYIAGAMPHFDALLIHHKDDPREPTSFGDDADAIGQLLQRVEGWSCIETSQALAPALGRLIERALGVAMRYLDDLHHTLTQPAPAMTHPRVRLLGLDDIPAILLAHPNEDIAQLEWRLRHGAMAGAIVNDQLVAIAQTYALSTRYCDIGVHTHESHRRQGYSTASTALVAREVQRRGLTPVWSTGEHNLASRRVAAKLGFREVGRMTYVIPQSHTSIW